MYLVTILFSFLLPLFAVELDLRSFVPQEEKYGGCFGRSGCFGQTIIDSEPYIPVKRTCDTQEISCTRNAIFLKNINGNYVNSDNEYLQAIPFDSCYDSSNLFTLSVDGLVLSPCATTSIALKTQLSCMPPVGSKFVQSVQVFDSLGVLRTLTFSWIKIDSPTPGVQALPVGATQYWKLAIDAENGSITPNAYGASGYGRTVGEDTGFIVSFDNTGKPVQWGYPVVGEATAFPPATPPNIGITWADGLAAASDIALNLGTIGQDNGMVSLGDQFWIVSTPVVNGFGPGQCSKAYVGPDKVVYVKYTNGQTVPYANIPLVVFDNPGRLSLDCGGLAIKARLVP